MRALLGEMHRNCYKQGLRGLSGLSMCFTCDGLAMDPWHDPMSMSPKKV